MMWFDGDGRKVRSGLASILFIIVLALAFSWPLLKNLSASGVWDWSEAASHYEATRNTVFYYGQFPLWNPYVCGGVPALANPQTYFLSLTGLSALMWGSVAGPKIAVVFYIMLGGLGIWLLARHFGAGKLAGLLAVPVFLASGFLASRLAAGQFLWLTIAWVPWIFYGYVKSRSSLWWLLLGSTALALIGIEGRIYLVVYAMLMLFSYGLLEDLASGWRARGTVRVVSLAAIAFIIGAWKFIPDLLFMSEAVGRLTDVAPLPVSMLPSMFLIRDVAPGADYAITGLSWVEYAAYIGWLPLLLAVGALFVAKVRSRAAPLVLAGIVILVLALSRPEKNPLELMPVVQDLRNYHRAVGMVVFVLAILAALGLEHVGKWLGLKSKGAVAAAKVAVLTFVTLDLLIVTAPVLTAGYTDIPEREGPDQIRLVEASFRHVSGFNDPYHAVVTNRGAKDACPAIMYKWLPSPPGSSVLSADDEKYKGEVWFDGRGSAFLESFSPNKIQVSVDADDDGVIIINQNFEKSWRASSGKVVSVGRVLGVQVKGGRQEITLTYWPRGLGIGLSLLALATIFGIFVFTRAILSW